MNLHYSGKGKGQPVTSHWKLGRGVSTCIAVPMRIVVVRWVSVVIAYTPASLPPGQITGTLRTGGWMEPRSGLDGCGEEKISYPTGVRSPNRLIPVKSLPTTLSSGRYNEGNRI